MVPCFGWKYVVFFRSIYEHSTSIHIYMFCFHSIDKGGLSHEATPASMLTIVLNVVFCLFFQGVDDDGLSYEAGPAPVSSVILNVLLMFCFRVSMTAARPLRLHMH